MKRLFLDTNIALDLLGERAPWAEDAARLASLADRGEVTLMASAVTFATVDCFLTKFSSASISRDKLRKFSTLCSIAASDQATIAKALESPIEDFEDALQLECARQAGCDVLITRNARDFRKASLPILSPSAYLVALKTTM